jgi:hypothetical protein
MGSQYVQHGGQRATRGGAREHSKPPYQLTLSAQLGSTMIVSTVSGWLEMLLSSTIKYTMPAYLREG